MSSVLVDELTDPRMCRHEEAEQLGRDGQAVFIRCVTCGSVVIVQGRHRWIIRPTDETGPLPF